MINQFLDKLRKSGSVFCKKMASREKFAVTFGWHFRFYWYNKYANFKKISKKSRSENQLVTNPFELKLFWNFQNAFLLVWRERSLPMPAKFVIPAPVIWQRSHEKLWNFKKRPNNEIVLLKQNCILSFKSILFS